MFKRILVPLDGSANAEKVLPTAIEMARLHDASVILLRVIAPLRHSLMASPSAINSAFEQIEQIVTDYMNGIAKTFTSEGINVEVVTERGSPALWTLDTAKERSCDLIIIGTHGETGSPQWRFGSVANKVVKARSGKPLLVIPTVMPE
jgi:nucleotide-binding universal stress UspA family protein